MTQPSLWSNCLTRLEQELSAQQFNTWIRPLQAVKEEHTLRLLAPNRFVMDWVKERFLTRIAELATQTDTSPQLNVSVEVGGEERTRVELKSAQPMRATPKATPVVGQLNGEFTFHNHVEGKSNQLARAA
ncbi:MAG: chromosomal replication initiator protein DnaA, partial [Nitrospira sp.]|nr:chromosomal replication initiator protein DnaA [Nitrospira sp.]